MNNEPAFPITNQGVNIDSGLTKLEYFAGLAMQARVHATVAAILGKGVLSDSQRHELRENNVAASIADAKALLAALEKESNAKG